MSTYIIGDLHGCYDELIKLLDLINFDQKNDRLLFTGDLVNGGPKSIETIQFVKALNSNHISILGNHDLALITLDKNPTLLKFYSRNKNLEKMENFKDILNHEDKETLLNWLIERPLLHFEKEFNTLLIHAGLYPFWSLEKAMDLAKEAEEILKNKDNLEFFYNLFGDLPTKWQDSLKGWERIRFIINAFTRMRFCDLNGNLELKTKGPISKTPTGFKPWFKILNKHIKNKNFKIVFGHWSALLGETNSDSVISLDTGCIWGGFLSAYRLDDEKKFKIPCKQYCTF